MHAKFISIGKTKTPALVTLEQLYLKRIQPFFKLDCCYVKSEIKLLQHLEKQSEHYVLLTETGRQYHSIQFAQRLDYWQQHYQTVTFVLGDSAGFSRSVIQLCPEQLSLSLLTFPHEIARTLLLEQLYRAATILKHHPYHK